MWKNPMLGLQWLCNATSSEKSRSDHILPAVLLGYGGHDEAMLPSWEQSVKRCFIEIRHSKTNSQRVIPTFGSNVDGIHTRFNVWRSTAAPFPRPKTCFFVTHHDDGQSPKKPTHSVMSGSWCDACTTTILATCGMEHILGVCVCACPRKDIFVGRADPHQNKV